MENTYEAFYNSVWKEVKKRLSCFELTDEEVDNYIQKEEDQIKSAYSGFLRKNANDARSDEARFVSAVNTVAMCLEYCY